MKRILSVFVVCFISVVSIAQPPVSIATDLSVLRQFSSDQKFWAVGQTVQMEFHFKETESAYASVCYYTNGKFKNNVTAVAKDATINPSTINYTANSMLRYRQISLGWKHYFRGVYNNDADWNLYGTAGFGLLFGRIETTTNAFIDTTKYIAKPISGSGGLKRLTFDLALGGEMLLGGGVYTYFELSSWLPASENPSPFLYKDKIPFVVAINGGLRILID